MFTSLTPSRKLLFFLFLAIASVASSQQIDIERIEEMPNYPNTYGMRDWHTVSLSYDTLVFDWDRTGEYLPLIWWYSSAINYPEHDAFGLETVVGTPRYHSGEAINVLAAVIGATLNGVDKSSQHGNDYVLMCEEFFNRRPEENIYLNNPVGQSGTDFWYDTMPNIFFYQLYDQYPGFGDSDSQFLTVADQWLAAVETMGGSAAPWDDAYMNYRGFSFSTMTPNASGVREPEAAGAVGWILYHAYKETGDERYRMGAEWAVEFLDSRTTNPSYELQMPYGAYIAAKMNAELGAGYDMGTLVDWCFSYQPLRAWGVMVGTWGDYDVHGLVGELSGNDYPFMMNGFEQAGALVPMVRYDDRFARAIGKWMLHLASASRLYYPAFLPAENQDSEEWSFEYDPQSVIGHEAIRETVNGHSPFATGDAISGGWGETNLTLYSSSHVGILGAIVDTTDVSMILQLDMLATDYYRDDAYPSYLLYNPYDTEQTVTLNVGNDAVDIYDAVANDFIATNVSGETEVQLAADDARVLVYCPAGGTVTYDLAKMLVDGVFVDYMSDNTVANWPPRIKGLAADPASPVRNEEVTLYATVEDRDEDELSYTWFAGAGEISGTGATVTWTTPDQAGEQTISVIANDGTDSDTTVIMVEVLASHPPVISNLYAEPNVVELGGVATLFCVATDADDDSLSYSWSADGGTITGEGAEVTWHAPDAEGTFTISCEVSDPYGMSASDELSLPVGDLVGMYWLMNGQALDTGAFDNDGTVNGATATDGRDGTPNGALLFDGEDNVIVPMSPSLNFNRAVSLSFWMKPTELPDREIFLISHGSWQNRYKVSLIPDDRIRWTLKTDTTTNNGIFDLDSETHVVTDQWYHVVVTYGEGQASVYVNGEQEGSITWNGSILQTDVDLCFAQMLPSDEAYNFIGVMDDIRIYNRVLDGTEVDELYHETDVANNNTALLPRHFALESVYPNPFNQETSIRFSLPLSGPVELRVYNIQGQLVTTLVNSRMDAGYHNLHWDAAGISSGVYFLQFHAGTVKQVQRCVLLK